MKSNLGGRGIGHIVLISVKLSILSSLLTEGLEPLTHSYQTGLSWYLSEGLGLTWVIPSLQPPWVGKSHLGFTVLPKKVFLLILWREMPNGLNLFYVYNANHIYVFILNLEYFHSKPWIMRFRNCMIVRPRQVCKV